MIGKKLYKNNLDHNDYTQTAIWCNAHEAHIEDKGEYYEVVANAPYVPTIQEQIEALEGTITARNLRSAIQGDQFALDKIAQVEAQIEVLRQQLLQGVE